MKQILKRRVFVVIAIVYLVPLSTFANYTGLPDFDYPSYWPEHEADETVKCAQVAVANALKYWDQKFPNLIGDSFGAPETQEFTDTEGKKYDMSSYWKVMSELAKDKYLGPGDVDPAKMETGIPQWFKDNKVGLSYHSTKGLKLPEEWAFLKKMIDKGEVPIIQIRVVKATGEVYWHWITGNGYTDDSSFSCYDPNVPGKSSQTYNVNEVVDLNDPSKNGWYFPYLDGQARIQSIQAITATAAVPEPASVILFGIGVIMAVWHKRRP